MAGEAQSVRLFVEVDRHYISGLHLVGRYDACDGTHYEALDRPLQVPRTVTIIGPFTKQELFSLISDRDDELIFLAIKQLTLKCLQLQIDNLSELFASQLAKDNDLVYSVHE